MIHGIWLALLGVLGAANLIIAKKPEAKELIGKIAPYQGWIGAVSALWGAWGVIQAILHIGWLAHWPIYWITWIVDSGLLLALGLLLGVGVFKTFIKSAEATAKMDQVIAKLTPYQGMLGLVAIGVGGWMVIAALLFTVG